MTYCDEYVCLWVCLGVSVCLSIRKDISGTAREMFTKFFVHVAYVRGLVVLRHVYNRPHRLSLGRVYFPIENALLAGKGAWSAQCRLSMLSMIALLCWCF